MNSKEARGHVPTRILLLEKYTPLIHCFLSREDISDKKKAYVLLQAMCFYEEILNVFDLWIALNHSHPIILEMKTIFKSGELQEMLREIFNINEGFGLSLKTQLNNMFKRYDANKRKL